MKVSVVIPSRGREHLLRRAVESCATATTGVKAVQVVVVVDGEPLTYASNLETTLPDVVVLRVMRPEGRGHARNLGLEAATGEFVKFLDDDDWLEPGTLGEELALAEAEGADIVVSGHLTAGEGLEARYWPPPPFDKGIDSLLAGDAVPTAAALYRRTAIGDIRWDLHHSKLDDWHFFVMVALRASVVARLDRPSYTWWAHPGQGVHGATMLDNAVDFYWVLDCIESALCDSGRLSVERRKRLAQYRYKELRVLCRFDRDSFEAEASRILKLDPEFNPIDEEPRAYLRLVARVLGFRRATLLLDAASKAVRFARAFGEQGASA